MTKILIVDDEKTIRELCQRILIKHDYIVETAQHVTEALEILDDTFDLVISDYRMPGSTGVCLAEQIKNKFNGRIPVIIMTGTIDDIKLSRRESLGVSDFILKPFNINEFLLKGSTIHKVKEMEI